MSPKLLGDGTGDVVLNVARRFEADEELASLREANRDLRERLVIAEQQLTQMQRATDQALGTLRRQLTPLFRALQGVFGELDAAGIASDGPNSASPHQSAVWASWKARLPGGPAKIIDALLVHRELNTQQLAVAIGVHRNSIGAMIFRLNKAGLLDKHGQKFSLKSLG